MDLIHHTEDVCFHCLLKLPWKADYNLCKQNNSSLFVQGNYTKILYTSRGLRNTKFANSSNQKTCKWILSTTYDSASVSLTESKTQSTPLSKLVVSNKKMKITKQSNTPASLLWKINFVQRYAIQCYTVFF